MPRAADDAAPDAHADCGALVGLLGILDFGYIITLRNPVADVFDLMPKCFYRLPPPNCSLISTMAIPFPVLSPLIKSYSILLV